MYKEASRKFSIVIDSRYNDNAIRLAKGANLFVCEASFSKDEENIARDYGHMTSMDATKIAKKAKVRTLALVHLSQRYDAIPKKILKEAKETFKEVFIPEDLDEIRL